MWKALKFAETVLENVDQTAAKVVNKEYDEEDEDYDVNEDDSSAFNEDDLKLENTTIVVDNNKSEHERLQDALKYSTKFFTDKTKINNVVESLSQIINQQQQQQQVNGDDDEEDEFKDIEEEDANTTTTTTTTISANEPIVGDNDILKSTITYLHDEVHHLNKVNDLLTRKVKQVSVQLQNREKYTKESQEVNS
jgi:hypothetical protein